jgi:acyl-CoA reductase-like NAD-dependent aldehyde dehydrogenase
MKYVPPGLPGSIVSVEPRYENFIGGKWLAPTHGKYRVDLAPATAGPITEVAHSTPEDVELALDAAHAAKDAWGEASATERAKVLNAIADAIEKNQDMLAVAETWENGKPVRETLAADIPLAAGYFFEPTVLKGHNKMRVFQEEIFGPVLAVTAFKDEAEALEIANDTLYGLGAGVWTRNGRLAYRMGRAIKAGRVWTNCYHQYPAGAAFGGYKMSGVGRELYRETLTEHYSQTKSLLVSYSDQPLGLF